MKILTKGKKRNIIDFAEIAVTDVQGLPNFSGHGSGGRLVVTDSASGSVLLSLLIGNVEPGDGGFADEKAGRLRLHVDDKSSYQSRNEAKQEWGGAIRAGTNIISFSGFMEPEDEAIALIIAVFVGLITIDEAEEIAGLSGNTIFADLEKLWC